MLFRGSRLAIENVCCRAVSPECSDTECNRRPSIAFVRSGVFRKHMGREEVLADANHVVFFNAGEEYRVSHPVGGGDDCTSFSFDAQSLADFARDLGTDGDDPQRPFALTHLACSSWTALRLYGMFRLLQSRGQRAPGKTEADSISSAAHGKQQDACEVEGLGLSLLNEIAAEGRMASALPRVRTQRGTAAAHRKIVDSARELIGADPSAPLTLDDMAEAAGASPYHLVRIFRDQTGLPPHRYRNQLRLRLALERIAQGERDLMSLALRLGFASHSHFTDAFRREFRMSPGAFRRG